MGRIGSWFSPWKVKGPQSPAQNASASSDQALESELEEESEKFVRPEAKEKQREEEQKVQSSNPHTLGPSRDIFDSEEGNATQSDHRTGSVVRSAEAREAGPRGEEFVGSRKKRTGQGKEWEESSNGTLEGGNPDKNATHVTDLSSEQGVKWDSPVAPPQAQRQTRARTGRRLHVYLEETSVSQCSEDAGQEVVRTKVPRRLQVVCSAKSSTTLDLSSCSRTKRSNLRPIDGTDRCNSTIAAASLTSNQDSEPKPEKEQTQADSMGRKNTPRRKSKKNNQGAGGGNPHEKIPSIAETAPEGSDNSVATPWGKSPKNEVEAPVSSSSKPNPTSQGSPECGESKTSCLDPVKQLGNLHESVTASTQAYMIDGPADMEDDDWRYKVERKTETPESKRRSLKVSVSEVKFFPKNVPLNPKQSTGENQDSKLKDTMDDGKDKPKTEVDSR